MWDLSRPDWADRIRSGRSLMPDLPALTADGDRAVEIFNRLRLPDVPDQPAMADAAGDWFREIVRALFGSWDSVCGERHIRELFALVPKKSSKTTYSAAVMVTAMLMSRRPRAEFLLVAPTHEVAALAFAQAVGMVEADPVLAAKCHIQEHLKKITFRDRGAFLKVKSFDPKVVTGTKPAGVLLDELHVIAEAHDADRVIGQLRGGLISQPEGFLINITTQSERPPSGVFKAELQKARQVRDGHLKAAILPILYEFPPGVDWRDTNNWAMVTPNNGRSITVDRLIPDFQQAEAAGEEELRRWASQHLNVEIGINLRSDRWAGADFWERCGDDSLTLDELLTRSEVVAIGIDGGGLDDLLGLAVIGRCKKTRKWLHWAHAWAHEIVLERRKSEAARLRDFAVDGDLTIVGRPGEDVAAVVELVLRIDASKRLAEKGVGVDAAGINDIVEALEAESFTNERICAIPQGWKMNSAIKTTERKLAGGEMTHCGSALMAWCAGNAKVVQAGNAILITKQASGSAKIDPLMATFNAVAIMAMNPKPKRKMIPRDYQVRVW